LTVRIRCSNLTSRISLFMVNLQGTLVFFVPSWDMKQIFDEHNALVQSVLVSWCSEDLDKEVSSTVSGPAGESLLKRESSFRQTEVVQWRLHTEYC
jgi:hypothetical protein